MSNLTYEPIPGESISIAAQNCIALAIEKNSLVDFKFNDVPLQARAGSLQDDIVKQYHKQIEENSERYKNSPEGKKASADREREIINKQNDVDSYVNALPKVLASGNIGGVIGWIKMFAESADDSAVEFDHKRVFAEFEKAGYKRNEYVLHEISRWFIKTFWKDFWNANRFARYIIGQVMDNLSHNMPPHQVVIYWCEDYFKKIKPE